MMIGIPCSGKSFFVQRYFNDVNIIIISTDKIRKEITGIYKYNKENNEYIFDIAKNNSSRVVAIVLKTPIEKCIARNNKRDSERRIPTDIILKMSKFSINKIKSEGFDKIKYIE